MRWLIGFGLLAFGLIWSCDNVSSCKRYASKYGCQYIVDEAEYEVWYWRKLDADNPDDNILIGRAIGLRMCEGNARAFASAIGEPWNYRAYMCALMDNGNLMEKHRLLDES